MGDQGTLIEVWVSGIARRRCKRAGDPEGGVRERDTPGLDVGERGTPGDPLVGPGKH